MKNVLWFSRHELTAEQIEGLKKVLNTQSIEVKTVNKTIQSAQEIKDEVTDEVLVAVVLPVGLLSELKAIMPDVLIALPKNKRDRDEVAGEFKFVYDGWEIVKKCVYESEIIK